MKWFKSLKCFLGLHKWLPMPHQYGIEWCDWCVKIRRPKMIRTTACMTCYLLGTEEEIRIHKCPGISGRWKR